MTFNFVSLGTKILLAGALSGCWCGLSAQAQAPVTNNALDSATSSSNPHRTAVVPPTEVASSNVAAAAPNSASSAIDTPDNKVRPNLTPKSVSQDKDKADDTYVVGIADDLQISVWKEPDLSGPVVVRPDGMITLPVINDVQVVGLTTKQVQDILTEKLQPVVNEPQVTVIVRTIRSRKVFLVGQVGHPGSVSLTGRETVLQIVAEAGGLGPYAKGDKIYILRPVGDHQQRINFNYKKALKGTDPKADFELISGDVIVVP